MKKSLRCHEEETTVSIFDPEHSIKKMETTCSSRTLVTIYQTRWCHIPEECNLDTHSHENHMSHIFKNHVKAIIPSISWSSKWSLPFRFSNQNTACIFHPFHECYTCNQSHPLNSIILLCVKYRNINKPFTVFQLVNFLVISSSKFSPYRTAGKIIGLDALSLLFHMGDRINQLLS